MSAVYHDLSRLFCPHRLGRNGKGEMCVLCYQHGGGSESGFEAPGSSAKWRCIALESSAMAAGRPARGSGDQVICGKTIPLVMTALPQPTDLSSLAKKRLNLLS